MSHRIAIALILEAYTKPWTVNLQFKATPDAQLIEYVCDENEQDVQHLVGK